MFPETSPYVVIAQQEWDGNLGSNARNLAVELSKSQRVVYVNPALDVNTCLKQIHTSKGIQRLKRAFGTGANTLKVAENIWVHTPAAISLSINRVSNIKLYDWVNRLNNFTFHTSLRKALKLIGIKPSECIVLNDSQMFTGQYLKKYFQPQKSFYYIRDNLVEHPYFKKHGSRVEAQTIKNADAVFANSSYLAEYAAQFNSHAYNIGQGCELDMYDAGKAYPEPDDMKAIPHPRIGYTGFLTGERLDIDLLETIAVAESDWQLVLIGPEEIMFQQSNLHTLKNVHFLGAKKSDELPAYVRHFDVCMNPQLLNMLTVGNYPRKIDEYLAMGKQVVATNTPAMQMFLPHVELALGANEYIKAIQKLLKPLPAKAYSAAVSFAKSHTWQACVEKIYVKQNESNENVVVQNTICGK